MPDGGEDLDWLYRREQDEHTAVLRPEDVGSLHDEPPTAAIASTRPDPEYPRTRHDLPRVAEPPTRPYPERTPPATPPPPTTAPPAPPTTRRRRRRPVLRIFLALFLAWLVFLIGTPIYAWTAGTQVDTSPSGERPGQQPGTTILLVGSDAREGLSSEERKRLGTGSTKGRRTDTMLLLHVPQSGPTILLSLPRDSLVKIPGRKKKNKLNAAYTFGGPTLLVETVESNTGIRVDGYLEVGFLGIVDTVDALGGIEVCPKFDFDDRDAHLKMSKGCQKVDGVTALNYARMRKSDRRGDLGRMERQREVISAIGKKALTPLTVINPVTYWRLNMATSKSLARGEETGPAEMFQAVSGFFATFTGSGISMSVPVSDANAHTSVGSAMIWDKSASKKVFEAIASGETTSLEKYRR